eukprot:2733671-Amphidinium_carterae.1
MHPEGYPVDVALWQTQSQMSQVREGPICKLTVEGPILTWVFQAYLIFSPQQTGFKPHTSHQSTLDSGKLVYCLLRREGARRKLQLEERGFIPSREEPKLIPSLAC